MTKIILKGIALITIAFIIGFSASFYGEIKQDLKECTVTLTEANEDVRECSKFASGVVEENYKMKKALNNLDKLTKNGKPFFINGNTICFPAPQGEK